MSIRSSKHFQFTPPGAGLKTVDGKQTTEIIIRPDLRLASGISPTGDSVAINTMQRDRLVFADIPLQRKGNLDEIKSRIGAHRLMVIELPVDCASRCSSFGLVLRESDKSHFRRDDVVSVIDEASMLKPMMQYVEKHNSMVDEIMAKREAEKAVLIEDADDSSHVLRM